MLKVKQFCFNPFAVSTFLLYDTDTLDAAVIDPGMVNDNERRIFDSVIKENHLKLTQIVNTHLHLDHCFGDNYVKSSYGVPVKANPADAFLGKALPAQAAGFGMSRPEGFEPVEIDVELNQGDTITVGNFNLQVLHVPGHSPGSIALYCAEGGFVIGGDVLFHGGIGRTDLQGGDLPTLLKSIREKLLTLPEETKVLPGHDVFTTIASEKRSNPYLRQANFEYFNGSK